MIRVGDKLYGFCEGYFGRDSYNDKRVEAVGADWVVAREEYCGPVFYVGDPEDLEEYKTPPKEDQ